MKGMRLLALALAGGSVMFTQLARAGTLQEDFSSDPASRGWQVFGNTNLFSWDALNQDLQVTWDSSRPNSYFYHRLGTILTREDDFSMAFDLRLADIRPGVNTNKIGAFELAICLCNFSEASRSNFLRGTGTDSPDLVEFDYFPDAGFGATIWPTFISTNSSFNYNGPSDYTALALTTNDWFRVVMTYTALNSTLTTTMTRNGAAFGPIHSVSLSTNFTDFRVDTFAISSYSDTGDDYDSLLAHGTVDNLAITTPLLPVIGMTGGFVSDNTWKVQFTSRSNWLYTLERTIDFQTWTSASSASGNGTNLVLQDTAPAPGKSFYRVSAQRP
jgi:hypothetical protein